MRIESVHAGLRRRRIKDELRLSILLQHGVVMTDDNGSVGIPVRSDAEAEQSEVDAKRKDRGAKDADNQAQKDFSKPLPEFRRSRRHEARL